MLTCHSRTARLRGSGLLAPRRRMATIACSMPASVYSGVVRKRKFSTLSLRSAVENGSFQHKASHQSGGKLHIPSSPNSPSCSAISFCEQFTLTLYVVAIAIAPFLTTSCHPASANLLDLKTLDNASKLGLYGVNYVSK